MKPSKFSDFVPVASESARRRTAATSLLLFLLVALPQVAGAAQSDAHDSHDEHEAHAEHESHDEHAEHDSHADHDSLTAHVHGAAHLLLALEGRVLQLEFQSPAFDLLGFEQAPRTTEESQRLDAVTASLGLHAQLVLLEDGKGASVCTQQAVELAPGLLGIGEHADVVVRYTLDCASAPVALQLPVFSNFPALEQVEVQWLLPAGQGAVLLTPAQPQHRF